MSSELVHDLRRRLRDNSQNHTYRSLRYRDTVAVIKSFVADHIDSPVQLEFVVENQRGMAIGGVPYYSSQLLLPFIDPLEFEKVGGGRLLIPHHNLNHYPLPGPQWEWSWPHWYVFMGEDVDDEGWVYARMLFSKYGHWKGKYYPGNFVRRRIWIRLRHKQ